MFCIEICISHLSDICKNSIKLIEINFNSQILSALIYRAGDVTQRIMKDSKQAWRYRGVCVHNCIPWWYFSDGERVVRNWTHQLHYSHAQQEPVKRWAECIRHGVWQALMCLYCCCHANVQMHACYDHSMKEYRKCVSEQIEMVDPSNVTSLFQHLIVFINSVTKLLRLFKSFNILFSQIKDKWNTQWVAGFTQHSSSDPILMFSSQV